MQYTVLDEIFGIFHHRRRHYYRTLVIILNRCLMNSQTET